MPWELLYVLIPCKICLSEVHEMKTTLKVCYIVDLLENIISHEMDCHTFTIFHIILVCAPHVHESSLSFSCDVKA